MHLKLKRRSCNFKIHSTYWFYKKKSHSCYTKIFKTKSWYDFKISFCPERTIEGKALEELSELPQIIGGYDKESSDISINFFNTYSKTVIDVGSLEAAELCKLIDNSYRDVKFAYANQIALLCEKLNLNAHDIISKVNLGYNRNDIAFPSPGVGGPCLIKILTFCITILLIIRSLKV